MRLATYDAIVARAERAAASSPSHYRLWVRFFAGIGFLVASVALFIGLMLSILALGILILAFVKGNLSESAFKMAGVVGFFGVGLTLSVGKSLFIGFSRPEGMTLKKSDASELFDEIERLRRALKVPPVHRVVLTEEFNASLYQRPRLGIFGYYENILILGLPLLRQFTVDQMRSIIAHELGHLHGEHGRQGAKIYRLRQTWQALVERGGSKLLGKFMAWYVPRFNAFTFVLARLQEREADRLASELTNATAAGSALVRIHIIGRLYPEFWKRLPVMAAHEPHAPSDILDRLDKSMNNPPPEARRWLREEMTRTNNRQDTHPCLSERLKIIGFVFRGHIPPAPGPENSAADHWLENPAECSAAFNSKWQTENTATWEYEHKRGKQLLERRDALKARCFDPDFTQEEHWDLVSLTHHFDGADAAKPTLMAYVALYPDHTAALYRLGADLLYEGDARGIPFIEAAMHYDHDAIAPGCLVMRDFADAYGHRELVEEAERKLEAYDDVEVEADAERSKIPEINQLTAHGLNAAEIENVSFSLQSHENVIAADVARIQVTLLPERPHFLVVIYLPTSWWNSREEDGDQKLIAAIMERIRLPGTCLIIFSDKQPALAHAVAELENARVFKRAEQ